MDQCDSARKIRSCICESVDFRVLQGLINLLIIPKKNLKEEMYNS